MGSSGRTKGVFHPKSSLKRIQPDPRQWEVKMPTLDAQLAKAQKSLAALEESMNVNPSMLYLFRRRRPDQYHDKDAELRGLRERVSHLQQRIAMRNERAELHATAETLVRLAGHWLERYEAMTPEQRESVYFVSGQSTHTSAPTVPE